MSSININRNFLIGFGTIILCLGFLYASVMKKLVFDWIELPDFSHGFFVPLWAFYFVYDQRKEWSAITLSGNWWGLAWILLGILILLIGRLASEIFMQGISLLIVLGGIVLFLLGNAAFKILLFPIFFLIFMIPIPSIFIDRITFPLQIFASKVATGALELVGIPVLREGNIIQLANTSLEVVEACSGIRSLMTMVCLSVAFSYFSQKTFLKRFLLVLSIFPIAILANAARVSGTGILSHFYGESAAEGFFHTYAGFFLMVISFICLFAISSLISKFKFPGSKRSEK